MIELRTTTRTNVDHHHRHCWGNRHRPKRRRTTIKHKTEMNKKKEVYSLHAANDALQHPLGARFVFVPDTARTRFVPINGISTQLAPNEFAARDPKNKSKTNLFFLSLFSFSFFMDRARRCRFQFQRLLIAFHLYARRIENYNKNSFTHFSYILKCDRSRQFG